jgi:hypothetical protein
VVAAHGQFNIIQFDIEAADNTGQHQNSPSFFTCSVRVLM